MPKSLLTTQSVSTRNSTHPTVSAILPNYNYAQYLPARLDEIIHQTYPVSELIILDDASTDDSISVLHRQLEIISTNFPQLRLITHFNRRNSGNVFAQWRQGVQLATSDYLWIAEADDSARSTFLSTVLQPCLRDPQVVLSYTNSAHVDSAGHPIASAILRQKLDFFRRRHSVGNYVVEGLTELNRNLAIFNSIPNVSAVLIKNEARLHLPQLLQQASQYQLVGDWYFYTQLALSGKIAYHSQKLNLHRLHSHSVTASLKLTERFREIQQLHAALIDTHLLQPSTIRRIHQSEAALARHWHLS